MHNVKMNEKYLVWCLKANCNCTYTCKHLPAHTHKNTHTHTQASSHTHTETHNYNILNAIKRGVKMWTDTNQYN